MSNFGEIIEPSSRTAWEDWDDNIYRETLPKLHLQKSKIIPNKIDTFLILEGRYFHNCLKAQNDVTHINSIPEVNLNLYKTNGKNNYICVIKDYNLVQSTEILELLKEFVEESTDLIGVLIKPIIEYQVAHPVTTDIVIRSICSNATNSKHPSLEQPNIIAGVSAGALCLREIMDKPAQILVCYTEHREEQQIMELQELLEKFNIVTHLKKRDSLLNSNLYI